jgi:adenosylcobinamide-GDP ribazoletransferase
MNGLRLALGFLTAIPVRADSAGPDDLGRAAAWFPAVGWLIGALLAGAGAALNLLFPSLLAAALVVALWAALTGGLHLDGLADCCDGLFASAAPERRLEIMRDSRLGAFGGIGLGLFLIVKVASVAALLSASPIAQNLLRITNYGLRGPLVALLLGPCLARWLILWVARQPSARPGGLGASFAAGLTPGSLVVAGLLPAVLIVLGGWRAVAATVAAGLVVWGAAALARARLGGVTGDVLGLSVELAELAVLLAYAAYV